MLGGGAGRRLGGVDKALVPLGGRPLIAHVLERLAPQVGTLAISANGDAARFARFGLAVLPDPDGGAGAGPLAGLLAGLDWAAALGAPALVTVAVDTPYVPRDLVERLVAAAGAGGLALAATTGGGGPALHPTAGLWPAALRDRLRAALAAGVRRLGDWATEQGARTAAFTDEAAFLNINSPDDLARAEEMLSR